MVTLTLEKIGGEKPWVAEIVGTHPKWKLDRQFVDAFIDYSGANSKGSRGIEYTYQLEDGIYEVKGGNTWGSVNDRKFIRVTGEEYSKLSMTEVLEAISEKVGA